MRLTADGLAGERGGGLVFRGVDFMLDAGGSLVVTGPNGAGKSTLLRVVAGLLPTAAGHITLEGGGAEWPTLAGALHYLGHKNAMKAALTVAENLRFWQDFCGVPRLSVDEALERAGLATIAHLPFGYLSTGQRRRAAIARLTVSHRPIWLLDEPTAGLDKASEERFGKLMNAHLDDGGIIIAATHLPLGLQGGQELALGGRGHG